MRVIFSCLPYYSHIFPVVLPVARALQRAGHTVAIATAPAMARELAEQGIESLPLPRVRTLEELMRDPDFAASPGMPDASDETPEQAAENRAKPGRITKLRAGELAGSFANDLISVARDWRPDLIIRESNEFGGYYAAEKLGLPPVMLDISPLNALHLPVLHDTINAQRTELGLDPVADPFHSSRGTVIGLISPDWYPESVPTIPERSYRPDPVTGRLDPMFADLPDDRPLVVAGLGTIAPKVVPEAGKLTEAMISALGDLPCTGLISVGDDWTGPHPDNVRLVPFVPLSLLLGGSELFLSHGGFGSVQLAMLAGTPMVNVPMFGDQVTNSHRIDELGLGVHVDPLNATPEALIKACERVLTDRSFRYRAAGLSRRIAALPGYDQLADDLAELKGRT